MLLDGSRILAMNDFPVRYAAFHVHSRRELLHWFYLIKECISILGHDTVLDTGW
jgi:hypothetical protein